MDQVEELIALRDRLVLNNIEWAALTKEVDPKGRGVSYQTIRRMESGSCNPRTSTLRILRRALLTYDG